MNDGGPAFPVKAMEWRLIDNRSTPVDVEHLGMSLRDWFAGQALAGLWAHMTGTTKETVGCEIQEIPARLANAAYKQADAMLAERAKGTS